MQRYMFIFVVAIPKIWDFDCINIIKVVIVVEFDHFSIAKKQSTFVK